MPKAPGANAVLDALVPVAHAGALQSRPSPLPQARASPWPCHREARGYRAPFISPTCPRASLATAASPALTGPSREPLHRPQRRRHQPAAACIAAIDSLRQALPEPALAHLQAHCEPLFLSPLLPPRIHAVSPASASTELRRPPWPTGVEHPVLLCPNQCSRCAPGTDRKQTSPSTLAVAAAPPAPTVGRAMAGPNASP